MYASVSARFAVPAIPSVARIRTAVPVPSRRLPLVQSSSLATRSTSTRPGPQRRISAALHSPNPPPTHAFPFTRPTAGSRSMSLSAAKRLVGKTVLITGASAGIGRSTAFEFARTAAAAGGPIRLILTARRIDTLHQIAKDIEQEVGADKVQVLPVQLDVSKPDEVRSFVDKLPAEWRNIDVLLNNAGLVKGMARAPEIAEEDTAIMLATNVTGLINMTQAILPLFLQRPDGSAPAGDIINIGSIAGLNPYAGGGIYCATKAAVRSFSDSLRQELVHTPIRVIEIDPGQVETEFSVIRFYGDKSKADEVYKGCVPLTPEDIAEIIVFSVSRPQNVVIANALIFPSHQATNGVIHRKL